MKENKKGCDLQTCFLCRLCMKEWIPAISAHKKNFQLKKNEMLFREGDPVKGIYFVYQGKLKVHKKWDEEKELIVRFAAEGDIVGHRGLGSDHFYPISATALEPATVCFIDLDFFHASLKTNYGFIYSLLMFYATELKESEKNMRNLAHMPVKGRVAHALLRLKDKFGYDKDGAIAIALSRQDLASYAGTTYETVFRIINELVRENIIYASLRSIIITDHEKLMMLSGEKVM